MATYLLTWNPAKYPWGDLADEARMLKRGEELLGRWSCGISKGIRKGDRLFMLKQGRPPRGIVASGWVESQGVYEDKHWDPEKRRRDITARYVDIRFETLLDPAKQAILDVSELSRGPLAKVHWRTQMSGIRIPDEATALLERLWTDHLDALKRGARPQVAQVAEPSGSTTDSGEPLDESALLKRITIDPRIFNGKPIIRGRRLAVEHVLAMLAAGDTPEIILDGYPWLEKADIQACLVYARRAVAHERIEPLTIATRS